MQQIRLRKDGEFWIILSADPVTELRIKKEGKNYFHVLKIETLEAEAKTMLDRIVKAEMVHSMQNNGEYADFGKLIGAGLLPSDVMTSETTGYNYTLKLADNRKQYSVSATPAVYGKTGKTSYWLDLNKEGKPQVKSEDRGGKPFDK
jgi:predicted secreted protein